MCVERRNFFPINTLSHFHSHLNNTGIRTNEITLTTHVSSPTMTKSISSTLRLVLQIVSHSLCCTGWCYNVTRARRMRVEIPADDDKPSPPSNTREIARDSLLRIFPPPTIERLMINNDVGGLDPFIRKYGFSYTLLVSIWCYFARSNIGIVLLDLARHTKRKFASPLLSRLIRQPRKSSHTSLTRPFSPLSFIQAPRRALFLARLN